MHPAAQLIASLLLTAGVLAQASPIAAPLADVQPRLRQQSSWQFEAATDDARDLGRRGAFLVGNGLVFTHLGLGDRASTALEVTGPTYDRAPTGNVTVELLVGDETWTPLRQRVHRVTGAAIVVTEDVFADGLALRTTTFAAPEAPTLTRVIAATNQGDHAIDGVRVRVGIAAESAIAVEHQLVAGQARLALHEGIAVQGALVASAPELAPGASWTTIATVSFDAAPGARSLDDAAHQLANTIRWWDDQLAHSLRFDTDHRRLADLVRDTQVNLLAQRCARTGVVMAMTSHREVDVRESTGALLALLQYGHHDAARAILRYHERAVRASRRITASVPAGRDLATETGSETNWNDVVVEDPAAAAWLVLQHFWYWRATRDPGPIEAHWALLDVCAKKTPRIDDVLLPARGDRHLFRDSVLFLAAVRATGSLVDAIDRERRPANWRSGRPERTPGDAYQDRALELMVRIERLFWLADEQRFAPALTADSLVPVRELDADATLFHDWAGIFWTGDKLRHTMTRALPELVHSGVRIASSATPGTTPTYLQGLLLFSIANKDGRSRLRCLDEVVRLADPAGAWPENFAPDGSPVAPALGHGRAHPFTTAVNLGAILFAICGSRINAAAQWHDEDIAVELRLPEPATWVTLRGLAQDDHIIDIYMSERFERLDLEERERNANLPPERRRDPAIEHRRLDFRIDLQSEDPPKGYWQVAVNAVNTVFMRQIARALPIEETELWHEDTTVFLR